MFGDGPFWYDTGIGKIYSIIDGSTGTPKTAFTLSGVVTNASSLVGKRHWLATSSTLISKMNEYHHLTRPTVEGLPTRTNPQGAPLVN